MAPWKYEEIQIRVKRLHIQQYYLVNKEAKIKVAPVFVLCKSQIIDLLPNPNEAFLLKSLLAFSSADCPKAHQFPLSLSTKICFNFYK